MFSLIICCFLYTVCAETSPQPKYFRNYLRSFKKLENERIQTDLIIRGITYFENEIFTAAKQGLSQYSSQPFDGCPAHIGPSELTPFGFDKMVCENIVNGIKALVAERFPDSELIYDIKTRCYTLKWD